MMKIYLIILLICVFLPKILFGDTTIIIQSTTSTKNSGFYNFILPIIAKETGVNANVVAVGTGAAIKNSMNCDGDILLVHSKEKEKEFVKLGFAKERYDLMYNQYYVIGPLSDPAKIIGTKTVVEAFKKIASKKAIFASRSDNSGTYIREKFIWSKAQVNPKQFSGKWYRETGQGMGSTINVAIGMGGYTLSDSATWINFGNKNDYKILFQGDKLLFNQYGIMLVNKDKCPTVKYSKGKKFLDWILSDRGQDFINSYRINGIQLFYGNSKNF